MERNPFLRPHCSPRNEEEVAKQFKRLQIVQGSLLALNRNLIAEIEPTLEQARDVAAAVSVARLQFSADRLARTNEKLEVLASGTTLDGQHDDALESVKESYRIIGWVQRRLHVQHEDIPHKSFAEEEQKRLHRTNYEPSDTDETKEEPEDDAGSDSKATTFTTLMGIPVIGDRPRVSPSSMTTSPAQTTACAFMKDPCAVMAVEMRHTRPHALLRPQDDVILETSHQERKAGREVSPQCMPSLSSPEENTPDDGSSSEGVTSEDHITEVLEHPPGCRYATTRKELPKHAAARSTDHSTATVYRHVSRRPPANGCKSSSPRERSAKDVAASLTTSRVNGTAKRVQKSRKRGGTSCATKLHECKNSKHLESPRTMNYSKKYACDSSPHVVIVQKNRPKVRRKAKSRRKGRPKIRKKDEFRHRLNTNDRLTEYRRLRTRI